MKTCSFNNHLIYTQYQGSKPKGVPLGVLVGKIGVGKSTLFNKITNNQVDAEEGGSSLTRKVFSSSSGYGEKFQLLDTPGTSSDVDKLRHGINLRLALTESPISRIFVLLQYKTRPSLMVQEFHEFLEFLSEWKNLITIVITYWDKEDDEKSRKLCKEIQQALLSCTNNIQDSFIFSGSLSSPAQICNSFYEQLCFLPPQQIKINDEYFLKKFDILGNMNQQVKEYTQKFQDITSEMLKEIENYSDESSKDEFYHACIVQIRLISEEMIMEFTQQYGHNMNAYDDYSYFMALKRICIPRIQKVRQEAQKKMSYDLFDTSNPKNMIKQCPKCHLYWVKVEGCDGSTTCGNRLSDGYWKDSKRNNFLRFLFFWKKGLKWQKNLITLPTTQPGKNDALRSTGVGCGTSFVWSDLPPLSNKKLEELKEAGVCDLLTKSDKEAKKEFENHFQKITNETKIIHL